MAKIQEFYKGRRKARNYALIPFVITLAVLAAVMVTFYGLQKYAVITEEGVSIQLPILADKSQVTVDEEGNEIRVFETVETELKFDDPDYSHIKATAGRYLTGIKAIFVPAEDVTEEKLSEYVGRLSRGNALILEMKPRSGQLLWSSNSIMAQNYALSPDPGQSVMMRRLIGNMKEQAANKSITIAAQISCCIDDLLPTRSTTVSLRTEYGMNYTDKSGSWLDPYNNDVRIYVAQMVQELWDLGFDEVILADVMHPVPEKNEDGSDKINFLYTRDMSTTPTPVNAVCGFAVSVADLIGDDRDGLLSIYCNSGTALVKADVSNGQDATLFMKLYDRVYYPTDTYAYTFNVEDMQKGMTIGDAHVRLVPVLTNYLFRADNDNASWVLVDKVAEN